MRFILRLAMVSFICLFQTTKTLNLFFSKKTTKTPKELYQELFKEPYTIKRIKTRPVLYDEIYKNINTIKKIYETQWEANNLQNKSFIETTLTKKDGNIETRIKNDTLQPMFQKIKLKPSDTVYFHGDLHGDVLSLLSLISKLQKKKKMDMLWRLKKKIFIFLLGDFTDRGLYSIETIAVLAKLLQQNPNHILLTRGNHETRDFEFKTTLYKSFVAADQDNPLSHAQFTHDLWLQATSYLPHVLFLIYPSQKNNEGNTESKACIACMHAAPPSYAVACKNNQITDLDNHCETIQNFLTSKKKLFTTTLELNECYRVENTYFPPYLWNYTRSYKSHEKKISAFQDGSPYLGAHDVFLWLKKCSSKSVTVKKIIRGHQQCERELFNQPGAYGIGNQFNNIDEKFKDIITTLNMAPRCKLQSITKGFWENRLDTWAKLKIQTAENSKGSQLLKPRYFDFENGLPVKIKGEPEQKDQNLTIVLDQ